MKHKRFLTVMKALWKNTHEGKRMTISKIIDYLDEAGLNVGLKAVRNDLKYLESEESLFKIDTYQESMQTEKHYWLENRQLELYELRYYVVVISR